ncbi:unnamed protein product [Victoria cruziana]
MAFEIASCILEGCKIFCDVCYPELKHIVKLKDSRDRLSDQFELLAMQKTAIMKYVEDGKRNGKVPSGGAEDALQGIEKSERDYRRILEKFDEKRLGVRGYYGCCKLLLELSQLVEEKGREMKTTWEKGLMYMGGEGVVVDPPPPMVEELPVPQVYGRQDVINEILRLLDDDGIRIVGVWGITGVGKTTVAKMVNNRLTGKKTLVFYVTVTEDPDIKGIQNQIARRLGMSFGEHDSEDARATSLFRRLKDDRFLLILEDVHCKLDLHLVGVSNGSDQSKMSKVLLTTSNFEVCKTMLNDETVEVKPLQGADAWCLFRETAGKVVESREIQPVAKKVAAVCEGMPRFLVNVGGIMRGVKEVGIWNNALREFKTLRLTRALSNSSMVDVEKDFRQMRRIYDRIPGRSAKLCFLYSCLFSRRYSVNVKRLVSYWRSEGFMDELGSKESTDKGLRMIEMFRNLCLLKAEDSFSSVNMLGLVRDMALKIADEEGHRFLVWDEETEPLRRWPTRGTIPQDIKRISLMGHRIQSLEDQPQHEWPELSTLILQRNPFESISDGFFHGMPALKVLDLSHTKIAALPPSVSSLVNAEAIYLGGCKCLREIPPIGKLTQLKLLDLSDTLIEELPQGLEELSLLKTLILSYTRKLITIRRGLMPCLSAIEELDMHQSAYTWGLEGMGKPEMATLEELSSLRKLEALWLNIQNPTCLIPNEFCEQWRMLWQFNFRIGESTELPRSHDRELCVVNCDGLLPRETVKMVLSRTQSLVLLNCMGISWISQVGGSLEDLKQLVIRDCDDVSSLVKGEENGAWGALEMLILQNLLNLEGIWMGKAPRGRSLANLRQIAVSDCSKLRRLFPIGAFWQVNNLEEIRVTKCVLMEEVFQEEAVEANPGGDSEIEEEAGLRCLRRVILEDLPGLTMVCNGECFLPSLEVIRAKCCPLLKNLPIREVGEIQRIEGSKIWWEQLRWRDQHIESKLERLFVDIGE